MKLNILKNVELKKFSTIKIGGIADYLYFAKSITKLKEICNYCKKHNIKYKVIGQGANLLFSDDGYRGMIIVNQSKKVAIKDGFVKANSGLSLTSFIKTCADLGVCGLEELAGIPATVGGAVVNNVSAFNTAISDYIVDVEAVIIDDQIKIIHLNKKECNFGYRQSIFQGKQYIITNVTFCLNKSNPEDINKNIFDAINKKIKNQPMDKPSLGSVFKRGNLIPSLCIDQMGLKGKQIGGAMISLKHAGFIINENNATSSDVIILINYIQDCALKTYKQEFDLEIEIVK